MQMQNATDPAAVSTQALENQWRALTIKGVEVADAILDLRKRVENRSARM